MGLLGDYTLRLNPNLGIPPANTTTGLALTPPTVAATDPAPATDAPATDGMSASDGFAIAKAGIQAGDALTELFGPQENPQAESSGNEPNPSGPPPFVQRMIYG